MSPTESELAEKRAKATSGENQMDRKLVDEQWLKSIGWLPIGNTWYPPESATPHQYVSPLMYWCRVDGAVKICGSEWSSVNDIMIDDFIRICDVLNITVPENSRSERSRYLVEVGSDFDRGINWKVSHRELLDATVESQVESAAAIAELAAKEKQQLTQTLAEVRATLALHGITLESGWSQALHELGVRLAEIKRLREALNELERRIQNTGSTLRGAHVNSNDLLGRVLRDLRNLRSEALSPRQQEPRKQGE